MISFLPHIATHILAPSYILAAGLTCPQITPSVIVREQTRPTEFVRNMSAVELTQMQKDMGFAPHSAHSFVQGLGGGALTLTGNVTFSLYGNDAHRCVAIKSVEAAIISAPLIHVARNYAQGSCEYSAVLEHEFKHVKILNDFRAEYAPKYQAELERLLKIAAPTGLIPRASAKAAQARKQAVMERGIKAYADKITAIMQRRQLAIDTPEEYRATHSKCRNWAEHRLGDDLGAAPPQSLYERYPPQIPAHRRKPLYNQ